MAAIEFTPEDFNRTTHLLPADEQPTTEHPTTNQNIVRQEIGSQETQYFQPPTEPIDSPAARALQMSDEQILRQIREVPRNSYTVTIPRPRQRSITGGRNGKSQRPEVELVEFAFTDKELAELRKEDELSLGKLTIINRKFANPDFANYALTHYGLTPQKALEEPELAHEAGMAYARLQSAVNEKLKHPGFKKYTSQQNYPERYESLYSCNLDAKEKVKNANMLFSLFEQDEEDCRSILAINGEEFSDLVPDEVLDLPADKRLRELRRRVSEFDQAKERRARRLDRQRRVEAEARAKEAETRAEKRRQHRAGLARAREKHIEKEQRDRRWARESNEIEDVIANGSEVKPKPRTKLRIPKVRARIVPEDDQTQVFKLDEMPYSAEDETSGMEGQDEGANKKITPARAGGALALAAGATITMLMTGKNPIQPGHIENLVAGTPIKDNKKIEAVHNTATEVHPESSSDNPNQQSQPAPGTDEAKQPQDSSKDKGVDNSAAASGTVQAVAAELAGHNNHESNQAPNGVETQANVQAAAVPATPNAGQTSPENQPAADPNSTPNAAPNGAANGAAPESAAPSTPVSPEVDNPNNPAANESQAAGNKVANQKDGEAMAAALAGQPENSISGPENQIATPAGETTPAAPAAQASPETPAATPTAPASPQEVVSESANIEKAAADLAGKEAPLEANAPASSAPTEAAPSVTGPSEAAAAALTQESGKKESNKPAETPSGNIPASPQEAESSAAALAGEQASPQSAPAATEAPPPAAETTTPESTAKALTVPTPETNAPPTPLTPGPIAPLASPPASAEKTGEKLAGVGEPKKHSSATAAGKIAIHGSYERNDGHGDDHAGVAMNYFMTDPDLKLTDVQAAVIVGVLQSEGLTRMDATITNGIGAHGIAQWLGGRRAALAAFAKERGHTEDHFPTQLAFVKYELTHVERFKPALAVIKNVKNWEDIDAAVYKFEEIYEVSGHELIANRRAAAKQIAKRARVAQGSARRAVPAAGVTTRRSPNKRRVTATKPKKPKHEASPNKNVDYLGFFPTYENGVRHEKGLSAIKGFPSSSEESTPGSNLYINGAGGNVIVSSEIADNVSALVRAAKNEAGIDLKASSSFRTMKHQTQLAYSPHSSPVADPGESMHQSGEAIDFNLGPGMSWNASDYPLEGGKRVYKASKVWRWLNANAHRFGLYQFKGEPWHFSTNGT